MDSDPIRRFAVGPFRDVEPLKGLALSTPLVTSQDSGWEFQEHAVIDAKDGLWLCTCDRDVRDRAAALLGPTYGVVTIDCWNSFTEEATIARLCIERHTDGNVAIEWADRRHPDLARAGVLDGVASEWLAQKVQSLSRATKPEGFLTKKEIDERERADRLLTLLVERSIIELAPGSSIADLGDRTRRMLFKLSGTRAEALVNLERMFLDSKYVEELHGEEADINRALDEIHYRGRAKANAPKAGARPKPKDPK